MKHCVAILFAALLCGCATQKPKPKIALPEPPAIYRGSRKFAAFAEVRKPMVLTWEDCEPQPPGVWYRIYETRDFKTWRLYAEVTNAHQIEILTTNGFAFYAVSATDGKKESTKAAKGCE